MSEYNLNRVWLVRFLPTLAVFLDMLLKNKTLKVLYLDGDSIGEGHSDTDWLSHTQQYTADTGADGEVLDMHLPLVWQMPRPPSHSAGPQQIPAHLK